MTTDSYAYRPSSDPDEDYRNRLRADFGAGRIDSAGYRAGLDAGHVGTRVHHLDDTTGAEVGTITRMDTANGVFDLAMADGSTRTDVVACHWQSHDDTYSCPWPGPAGL